MDSKTLPTAQRGSLRQTGARALRQMRQRARLRLLGTTVGVATNEPLVALTFDDGPHPEFTPKLLDILERHHARATFFVIGKQVLAHPAIARNAFERGHTIANHTHDHPLFLTLDSRARREQIHRCHQAITPIGGVKLFRPPKGHQTHASRRDIWRTGHHPITWSANGEDWLPHEPEWMVARIERTLRAGSIILMHDAIWDPMAPGAEDRSAALAAVDLLLTRSRGHFRFVTVPELLRSGQPIRRDWVYPKP